MLSEKETSVIQLIDQNQSEVVAFLQQLIRYKTLTPRSGEVAEGGDYKALQGDVSSLLTSMGFSVESWEVIPKELHDFPGSGINKNRDLSNMPIVLGELKGNGEGRSLILNGHYDVVPTGEITNWKHNPFEAILEDGKIFGRGACDMKAGIAAMLMAVKFLKQAGVELAGDLIVQTVPDEEMSCMGTLSCCQRGYKADAAIIPEPADMQVLIAMRGSKFGVIHVYGRAGHAEMAQPHWRDGGAVNAIGKAAIIVEALEGLVDKWRKEPEKQHEYVPGTMVIPTKITGGEWEVTYPEKTDINFSLMFPPGGESCAEELIEHITQAAQADPWMKEHPPEVEFSPVSFYGAEISGDEPIAQLGIEVLKELGYKPQFKGFGSLTDAIHLINQAKVPTISIGPSSVPAHTPDEYVEITELIDTTKAMALAVMRWCGVVD